MRSIYSITIVAALVGTVRAQPAEPTPELAAAPPATASTTPRSLVLHVAPLEITAGEPLELVAQIDAPYAETLFVGWRLVGETQWREAAFDRSSAGGWFASIPNEGVRGGIEYFIAGRDPSGTEVMHFASAASPHLVRIVPSLDDRLEELDRQRLGDRMNQVTLDVAGHNFGNRYDLRDDFLRGEVTYTRRILRPLHHLAFGFGSIQGSTPAGPDPLLGEVDKGLRYGFGELRLRAHPSVYFDVRGILGASHAGFTGGARGAVTFGKPWRSSLQIGGEALGDVGASGWVRLQWDTAPPFLMAASIVRTDLPGAEISSAGLYLAFDATYPATDRIAIRGQVSYGSRDGAAHVGGGLGTSVDF